MTSPRASLLTGPIFQICWVVDDLDGSERWFTDYLGVPAWTRWDQVHFGPEHCTYRGKPADYVIDISIGYASSQQIELIEPSRGVNLYTEHLERSGPGLHHVAFLPGDFRATVAEAQRRGMAITQRGEFEGGIEYVYLDGSAGGAPHIELMKLEAPMRAYFDSLAAESARLAAARA